MDAEENSSGSVKHAVAILSYCLKSIFSGKEEGALGGVNIISEVLQMCGNRGGESTLQWGERLQEMYERGLADVLNRQNATSSGDMEKEEIKAIQTTFGDVLEVYVVHALPLLGEVYLDDIGGDATELGDNHWEVEQTLISKWPEDAWVGVGKAHIPRSNIQPAPGANGLTLWQSIEEIFIEDPSTDVAALIKQGERRLLLHIQCKAASDPNNSNIDPADILKFKYQTTMFREQLRHSRSQGLDGGIEKILGILFTNASDYVYSAENNKDEPHHHLCSPSIEAGARILYEKLGSEEIAREILAVMKNEAPPEITPPLRRREPRTWQADSIKVFEEAVLPTYKLFRPVRLAALRHNSTEALQLWDEAQQKLNEVPDREIQDVEPYRNWENEQPVEKLLWSPPDDSGNSTLRFQVIAPCGAGKTTLMGMLTSKFHSFLISEIALGPGTSGGGSSSTGAGPSSQNTCTIAMVAAPLIEIAASNAQEIMEHLRGEKMVVQAVVCASLISKDKATALGRRALPPNETVEWLRAKALNSQFLIVGVTYDSQYKLLEQLSKQRPPAHVILFLDEAHRTAGPFRQVDQSGNIISGPGSAWSPQKVFSEFYHLFEFVCAVTATPKVHPNNNELLGPQNDSDVYGNGLKYCGIPFRNLSVPDRSSGADGNDERSETIECSSQEEEEEEGEEEEDDDDDDDRSGVSKAVHSSKSIKKSKIPYNRRAFNCQNDAFGAYGPILVNLCRDRALEEGIIVEEVIQLLGTRSENELEINLQRAVTNWRNAEQSGGVWERDKELLDNRDEKFTKEAKELEIRRICLIWTVLLDVAAGEHSHVSCFFSRQAAAKAGVEMARFLARFLADKIDANRNETCATYNLDPADAYAAVVRLRTLAENCYALISDEAGKKNRKELERFKNCPVGLITSVHMMKIGVNVPQMSACVHCDPMANPTDIEQANGRARRSAPQLKILQADNSFIKKKKVRCVIYAPIQLDISATLADIDKVVKSMEKKWEEDPSSVRTEEDERERLYTLEQAKDVERSFAMFRAVILRSKEPEEMSTIVGLLKAALTSSGSSARRKAKGGLYNTRTIKLKDVNAVGRSHFDADTEIEISCGDSMLEDLLAICAKRQNLNPIPSVDAAAAAAAVQTQQLFRNGLLGRKHKTGKKRKKS